MLAFKGLSEAYNATVEISYQIDYLTVEPRHDCTVLHCTALYLPSDLCEIKVLAY